MADVFFEVAKDGTIRNAFTLRPGDKGRRGGSGIVYELPTEPGKAIKIYHDDQRAKFEPKVRTMVKVKYNRPHLDRFDLAWPESLVVDDSGKFCGFKMPFFGEGWVDLEKLMQASEVEQKYRIGELQRLMIGANLAMAVKALHDLKVYCIDLKPDNARVNLNNLATALIDCDGMSVVDIGMANSPRFYGDKCTPEFWAPENIGLKPHKFRGEEAHDRFALATIIFMLLNRGLHPYQGVMAFDEPGTGTVAGKIKNNLYPYGAGRGRIVPHKDSLYNFLPDETKGLFDRAYSGSTSRPSADEWLNHLNGLALEADNCEKDQYHIKYRLSGCPICRRDYATSAGYQWATLVGSSARAALDPRLTSKPQITVVPPTAAAQTTPTPTGFAPPKSPRSPVPVLLGTVALAVFGVFYLTVVTDRQKAPPTTRPSVQAPAGPQLVAPPSTSSNVQPASLPTSNEAGEPKPPLPPKAPPKPSLATVMTSSGLIGVWSSACNVRPNANNEHISYSVTSSGEGRASIDTGVRRNEFIIRSAEGAHNRIELRLEQLPQRTGTHLVLLIEGNRYRTWTNRVGNGQVLVENGISATTGQPTLWRARCGSSLPGQPAGQRCVAGGVNWHCDAGLRCGSTPGTCQPIQSAPTGRSVDVGRPVPVGR